MKIAHVHKYYYLRRGAERYMFDVMHAQMEDGHSAAPFSMHHPENWITPWSDFFVPHFDTSQITMDATVFAQMARMYWSREAYNRMKMFLRVFRPDVLHAHNVYTHLSPSVLAAAKEEGVPVVMTVHDYALVSANYALWDVRGFPMDFHRTGVLRTAQSRYIKGSYAATFALALIQKMQRMRKLYEKNIDRFLVSTEFMKNVLMSAGYPEDKIVVQGLFVPDRTFNYEIPKQDYVLFVGQLEDNKGVDVLLEAMKAHPDTPVKIAGTGVEMARLKTMAQEMKNVEFLGFLGAQALWKTMAAARVLVVPSVWYEPYGLVAIEAMIQGTPVIVSDRGGLPELIEDDVCGRIVPAGDAEALADAIARFAYDRDYALSLGEIARTHALEIANEERHMARLYKVYKEIQGD